MVFVSIPIGPVIYVGARLYCYIRNKKVDSDLRKAQAGKLPYLRQKKSTLFRKRRTSAADASSVKSKRPRSLWRRNSIINDLRTSSASTDEFVYGPPPDPTSLPKRASFMGLPPELRLRIYEVYFGAAAEGLAETACCRLRPQPNKDGTHYGLPCCLTDTARNCLALCYVNCQIYSESIADFYRMLGRTFFGGHMFHSLKTMRSLQTCLQRYFDHKPSKPNGDIYARMSMMRLRHPACYMSLERQPTPAEPQLSLALEIESDFRELLDILERNNVINPESRVFLPFLQKVKMSIPMPNHDPVAIIQLSKPSPRVVLKGWLMAIDWACDGNVTAPTFKSLPPLDENDPIIRQEGRLWLGVTGGTRNSLGVRWKGRMNGSER